MIPATIIREAQADGITLALTLTGIKIMGERRTIDRWLGTLRNHKAGLVEVLRHRVASNDAIHATPAKPLAPEVEVKIRYWLELIGETDREAIETFVLACRGDSEAQRWVTDRLDSLR